MWILDRGVAEERARRSRQAEEAPTMDIDHFVRIVHSLSATPSRRAAIRGLAGLTAGSFLAPFADSATAKRRGGKKKHHKKRKRTRRVCQEADGPTCHYCPEGQGHCPIDGKCC